MPTDTLTWPVSTSIMHRYEIHGYEAGAFKRVWLGTGSAVIPPGNLARLPGGCATTRASGLMKSSGCYRI
jgi:hypothetical protein